jgi:parallel beta-helix repeat protein
MPQTSGSPGFGDTPRGPISINGNSQFDVAHGVNGGGAGTFASPYIIENYAIDASGANGIDIQNTTKCFIVRNCLVENGGEDYSGIYLYNVNGRIENNTCSNNIYGIYLGSSSHDNLTGNTCDNNGDSGIYLEGSSNNILENNNCSNNSVAIYIFSSSNYNIIDNNTCSNNGAGIYLGSSSYENLTGNICESGADGIYLDSSDYNILENNTCSNNSDSGIWLSPSSYDNLTGNICENNGNYGIYLDSSSYDNLTGNTANSNYYGIWLTSSSYDNLTGNVISNNGYDIYTEATTNTSYSSNQFNNNITSTMLTFTDNIRTENVGDNVSFSISAFNLDGTNYNGWTTFTTSPITISPSESSFSYSENGSGTVTGSFTPTRSGIYSLNFTVTDENSNTTRSRMLFFVGNTASTTTKYYFRGVNPTHGQPYGNGGDAKTLLLVAPTSIEEWHCGIFAQNSPDNIPNYPLANLSSIDTYTWYHQSKVSGAYIGVQRCVRYSGDVDFSSSVENVLDYTWTNENFTGLNWAMTYPQSWYRLALKLYGTDTFWTTFPSGHSASEASYANFTYSYTTTPIVKSISNPYNITLLSATAPADYNNNATIVLDGTGSTNIVLDNYHRPFIAYTTTINSDNTTIAANGLTGTTTINSVAMDLTPSSGYIGVSIDTWNTSGTYYKKWTETGSSSDITAIHTVDNLEANAHYTVKVGGILFDTYQSNSSGQITFTYNGGDSTKTFEIEHIPPNKPDTLRVEGQTSPQQLTTFTPEFSLRYTDNYNYNSSMAQIQVGTSDGDNSMWDNQQVKNVENGATISITYAGTALQRGVQYYWRARVRDNENFWSDWSDNENIKLSPSPTVTVGDNTIELTLLEAGDTPVIPTSDFTIMLTIRTRSENLLIYYARIEEPPQIPAEGVAPFYFDISTTNPDAISGATITFNIPKSWVRANDIIPSTLVAWRYSNGVWQTLPSRLVGEDALYYYLEATTSGFSLFGVSGQKNVVASTELPTGASTSQTPPSGQQTQQLIFIAALGIFVFSVMILISSFKRHKRRK